MPFVESEKALDLEAFSDSTKGILYDAGGVLRNPTASFNFFIDVANYVAEYNALTSAQKQLVNPTLTAAGIDLTNGLNLLSELVAFGDPLKGVLYNLDGSLKHPIDIANFQMAVDNYVAAYNALLAANKTKVDPILLLLGLNLSDGVGALELEAFSDSTKGILYDAGGVLRNPTASFNFFIDVANYVAEYNALTSAQKLLVNPTLTAAGIDLTNGLNLLSELVAFGDPLKGVLYNLDGSLKHPIDIANFQMAVDNYVAAYNALLAANKTK